jgi:hypothetical protein
MGIAADQSSPYVAQHRPTTLAAHMVMRKQTGLRRRRTARGPEAHANSTRPEEYGGTEYGGLPVKAAAFVILTCSNVIGLHRHFR